MKPVNIPTENPPTSTSRLPHRVALLLAMVVFPLIWVGGLVTTYDAGMSVPDWPGTYGYNMFLYPLETWLFGPFDLLVEHGHRLLGSAAGLIAILLVWVTWRSEPRGWVRKFSIGLLALVIAQGCLGGFRVLLDARVLAKIHGCIGPAFFASVIAFCVVTSRWWSLQKATAPVSSDNRSGRIWGRMAIAMLVVSFGQLVIGAWLRHIGNEAQPSTYVVLIAMHVTTAVLLVLGTTIHWWGTRRPRWSQSGVRRSADLLLALVGLQFVLGLTTWVLKFGWPAWFANYAFAAEFVVGEKTFLQMNLVTAHVAVGSLILSVWTMHAIRINRVLHLGAPASPLASREIPDTRSTRALADSTQTVGSA